MHAMSSCEPSLTPLSGRPCMVDVEVLGLASTRFSGICQAALCHLSGSCFKVRVNGLTKPTDVFDTESLHTGGRNDHAS